MPSLFFIAIIFNCISRLLKINLSSYSRLSVITVIFFFFFTANESTYIGSLTTSDSHISLQVLLMLLPACKLQLCVHMCVCVWTLGAPNDSAYPWKEVENISVMYVEFRIRQELDLLIPKSF